MNFLMNTLEKKRYTGTIVESKCNTLNASAMVWGKTLQIHSCSYDIRMKDIAIESCSIVKKILIPSTKTIDKQTKAIKAFEN